MQFFKKQIFNITLGFIITFLTILSVYSLVNYNNTSNIAQQQQSSANSNQDNNPPTQKPNGFNQNLKVMDRMNTSTTNSNSSYSLSFIAYCVIFFTLFIAIFLLLVYKKIKISNENIPLLLVGIIISGFLFRIFAALLIDGHPYDINVYKGWATNAAKNFLSIYSNHSSVDYPPLYLYILFIVGKISSITVLSKYTILSLKLPSIIADIVSGFFIYRIGKTHISKEISLVLAAFYVFNPAVLINSTIWGQVDSFFTLIIILAIYLLAENKLVYSTIFFTSAALMKPQGIIFLPLLLFAYISKRNFKEIVQSILTGAVTALLIILPFSIYQGGFTWIFKLYSSEVSAYPYATYNAFNFFGLIDANTVKDTTILLIFNYHTWGMLAIVLITSFSGFIYIKGNSKAAILMASLLEIVGVFNFSVGMHERYLFTALGLCLLCYIYINDKRLLILSILFSLTIYINTHVALFEQFKNIGTIAYSPIVFVTSLLNVLCFIYLLVLAVQLFIMKSSKLTNNNYS